MRFPPHSMVEDCAAVLGKSARTPERPTARPSRATANLAYWARIHVCLSIREHFHCHVRMLVLGALYRHIFTAMTIIGSSHLLASVLQIVKSDEAFLLFIPQG